MEHHETLEFLRSVAGDWILLLKPANKAIGIKSSVGCGTCMSNAS